MSPMANIAALMAILLVGADAHIKMVQPVPFSVDSLDNAPIKAADFPCKQSLGFDISQMNEMATGSSQTVTFEGSAVHAGGSCQLAITLDTEPTASSTFKVIHSIMGGCPGVDGATEAFDFTLPPEVPNGPATFAWTWFARLGGQPEMYMNCAPITITGGADDTSVFEQLPDMFVANIETAQCTSPQNMDTIFPNPGQSVIEGPGAKLEVPEGAGCGAAGTGGGSGSGSNGNTGGGGNNGDGAIDNGNPGNGGGVNGGNSQNGGNEVIEDGGNENSGIDDGSVDNGNAGNDGLGEDDGNGIVVEPVDPTFEIPPVQSETIQSPQPSFSSEATSTSQGPENGVGIVEPSATPVAPSDNLATEVPAPTTFRSVTTRPIESAPPTPPSAADPAGPSDSSPGAGNGNGGGASTACTGNGDMMCQGTSQFGLCNNGQVIWQAVAPGTRCENGAIV